MAKSYFGYVERKAGDFVNWAAIGENLTQIIQEEGRRREEIKSAIDQADREWGAILAAPPQGKSTTFNEWALKAGEEGTNYRLMTTKLLKSGKLKLNDYLVGRQNAVDGFNSLFDIMREYNQEAQQRIDDFNNGKTAKLDMNVMADIEGFANYGQTGIYINPLNGEVNIAFKEKTTDANGNEIYTMSTNPNKFATVNSLRNRISTRYNKFDMNAEVGSFVQSLGPQIKIIERVRATTTKQGQIMAVKDVLTNPNLPKDAKGVVMTFEEAETKMLQSYLTNNFKAASVLTDYIGVEETTGQAYDFTWDETEAKNNPNLILKKKDDNGNLILELSDQQKNAAMERLRLEARERYGREESLSTTGTTPFAPSRGGGGSGLSQEEKDAENLARQIAFLVTGTQEQGDAATSYFSSKGVLVNKAGSTVSITNDKGIRVPDYTLSGAPPFDIATSMIAPLNAGQKPVPENLVVKYLRNFLGSSFNTGSVTQGQVAVYNKDAFDAYIDQVINTDNVITDGEQSTPKNLNKVLKDLGFEVSGTESGLFGGYKTDITIKAPNGVSTTINIDNVGEGTLSTINQFIKNNMDPNLAGRMFAPR